MGIELNNDLVYSCNGFINISSQEPISTISPECITATLSEIYLTIDKSCAINKIVNPSSSCNFNSRFIICAWIETSNADIGSSAIINSGSTANALAIPILCLCPPENSCGYLLACSLFNPTLANNSYTLCSLSILFFANLCISMPSAIMSIIFILGLSEA
ncbi:hypothetical protein STACA0001_0142 [Staphylococcus capitis SK14]|nr:hypothetical protein STACA0001_0142 [Staphylococcus capitis SK14]